MLLRIASAFGRSGSSPAASPSDAQEADEARAGCRCARPLRRQPGRVARRRSGRRGHVPRHRMSGRGNLPHAARRRPSRSRRSAGARHRPRAWSTVTINGVPFVPTGSQGLCQSGDGEGMAFNGVDLHDAAGDTLRVVETPGLAFESLAIMPADEDQLAFHSRAAPMATSIRTRTAPASPATRRSIARAASWTIRGTVTFPTGCLEVYSKRGYAAGGFQILGLRVYDLAGEASRSSATCPVPSTPRGRVGPRAAPDVAAPERAHSGARCPQARPEGGRPRQPGP